jgi:hypothetical protein
MKSILKLVSTLMTSAPITASHWDKCGPAHICPKSVTLIPSRGSFCILSSQTCYRKRALIGCVQILIFGYWYLVFSIWFLVIGYWYLVLGTWFLILTFDF